LSWKFRGRLAGLLLLSLSFIAANAGYSIGPARAGVGDPATVHRPSQTKMIAAQSAALDHFDKFLAFILDNNGVAQPDAGVKVAVPDGNGDHKLIWLDLVAKHDGQFVGRLNDASRAIIGQRVGDVIGFNEAQIRDWYFYGLNGELYGAFTARAVVDDLPADTAAKIGLHLSDTALPAHW